MDDPMSVNQPTLNLSELSAERDRIQSAFFQHLRLALEREGPLVRRSESPSRSPLGPAPGWLVRAALRIERAVHWLRRAIAPRQVKR